MISIFNHSSHIISYSFSSINQPNIQKFRNTVSVGLKVVASLVEMHGHSPGDAVQGEDYPTHLLEIITLYNKVMNQAEDTATPTVSMDNYAVQDKLVGICTPVGIDTAASPRFSTRKQNKKSGLNLVERFKRGNAYVSKKTDSNDSQAF